MSLSNKQKTFTVHRLNFNIRFVNSSSTHNANGERSKTLFVFFKFNQVSNGDDILIVPLQCTVCISRDKWAIRKQKNKIASDSGSGLAVRLRGARAPRPRPARPAHPFSQLQPPPQTVVSLPGPYSANTNGCLQNTRKTSASSAFSNVACLCASVASDFSGIIIVYVQLGFF